MSDIIKTVLHNKDGTVEYVFDKEKLNEILSPLINQNTPKADTEER